MTPDRFEMLAEAYGGDLARWPAAEREAAADWMAANADQAQAALAPAAALDALLDAAPSPQASAALAVWIAAGAPQARRARRAGWWLPAGMGAGLAAACAAGVAVGVQLGPSEINEDEAVMAAVSEGLGLYADDGA